ncbi:MAG: hypothetical protein QOF19_1946 [Alphaproteobacteria bacterium]|nr:hypothetical protein [Alphaproteobacteria bacterium]
MMLPLQPKQSADSKLAFDAVALDRIFFNLYDAMNRCRQELIDAVYRQAAEHEATNPSTAELDRWADDGGPVRD